MNTFLAVLTGGGLAAVGGLLSGWLNNWLGGRRDQHAHAREQQMSREALGQERLDRTYTELGMYLSHYADWARSMAKDMTPATDPVLPGERWRIETLVMNHGSPEVRQLLERWGEQARKVDHVAAVIQMGDQSRASWLAEEVRRKRLELAEYGTAMHEAATAIRDQMWRELAGQAQPALESGESAST